MASYDYGCDDCKIKLEKTHSMNDSPVYECPQCGKPLTRLFSLSAGGFFVRGGTPSSHWKEKRMRMKKREDISARQNRNTGGKVQPNIAGYEVDSWSDAQRMAKEAGMAHDSYTPWVDKEKSKLVVASAGISAPTKVIAKI